MRRSRSISQAPNVSRLDTCDTSINILDRLPVNLSALDTICSSSLAKRAVQGPAAHKAMPPPFAIGCSVGSPFTIKAPELRLGLQLEEESFGEENPFAPRSSP